jgi:GT2 family glycosyltransferase
MTTILFALIHYGNTDAIRTAVGRLRSLHVPGGWRRAVLVADNSADAPEDLGVDVVSTGGNLGYLGGAAAVLDWWRTRHQDPPDWFVIVNPDVGLRDTTLLTLGELRFADDVAIVAPAVLLGGITPQNPFLDGRPSRLRMRTYTIAFRSAVLTHVLDRLLDMKHLVARRRPAGSGEPRAIYAPHGSIMFIRRVFFDRGGMLKFAGFMFGEEIHLAEQVRRLGLRVLFVPAMEVMHEGKSTTGRVESDRRREWHRASADILWEDYFR